MKSRPLFSILLFFLITNLFCQLQEGFETGDFTSYAWTLSGNVNWQVTDNNPSEGNYCAKSGAITHNQTSTISLTYDFEADGQLSFFWKVSSESGYDFMKFKLDGQEMASWSGIQPWTNLAYYITQGSHTISWTYQKDVSDAAGSDTGWIDNIVFTPLNTEFQYDLAAQELSGPQYIADGDQPQFTLQVQNLGTQDISFFYTKLYDKNNTLMDSSLVILSLTPMQTGETTITLDALEITQPEYQEFYAEVEFPQDENTGNDISLPVFSIYMTQDYSPVMHNEGEELTRYCPMALSYRNSLSQMLLYTDELFLPGEIVSVSFQYNFVADLPEIPVKIWMGETMQENLTDGWVSCDSLQLVFNGLTDFNAGNHFVTIELDTLFAYYGDNLLITVERCFDEQVYSYNNVFYYADDLNHAGRTRTAFSDNLPVNPSSPEDGVLLDFFPNMSLMSMPFTSGSISGLITSNDFENMEGTRIAVQNTAYETFADNSGEYLLADIPLGTYNLEISKSDYDTIIAENVVIIPGETMRLDFEMISNVLADDNTIASKFMLLGNYPNPFVTNATRNSGTAISFSLPEKTAVVKVDIYNVKGQLIRVLKGTNMERGEQNLIWDGTDQFNNKSASGIYLYKVETGSESQAGKMILIRN